MKVRVGQGRDESLKGHQSEEKGGGFANVARAVQTKWIDGQCMMVGQSYVRVEMSVREWKCKEKEKTRQGREDYSSYLSDLLLTG